MNLSKLSDRELMMRAETAARNEKDWNQKLILHLAEIYRRDLHLKEGDASLKAYCIRVLGYDEASAARRESAARLMLESSEARKAVEKGKLTVTRASQIGSFLRREEAIRGSQGEKVEREEKKEIVDVAVNGTGAELETLMAKTTWQPDPRKREKTRVLKDGKTRIVQFEADEETWEMIERVKDVMSHQNPGMSTSLAMKMALKFYLKKKDPAREVRSTTSQRSNQAKRSPNASERSAILKRAQNKCEFVNKKTGKRCGSGYKLQIDHRTPYSQGGKTKIENLRALCAKHNLYEAKRKGVHRDQRE